MRERVEMRSVELSRSESMYTGERRDCENSMLSVTNLSSMTSQFENKNEKKSSLTLCGADSDLKHAKSIKSILTLYFTSAAAIHASMHRFSSDHRS